MQRTSQSSLRRSIVPRLIAAAFNLYGLTVMILLVAKLLIGERLIVMGRYTPVGLFNSFLPIALLPALIFFPLALLLRRPFAAALQVPALVVFIIGYGILFVPDTPSVSANAPRFTLLSYNLLANVTEYTPQIDIIRASDADVVALQELTEKAAQVIEAELSDFYPYRIFHPFGQTVSGCGVLSRYPITNESFWMEPMCQQQMMLQVDDTPISLFNVHPPIPVLYGANPGYRSQTIQHILEQADAASIPILLVGDFNMTDSSDDYAKVRAANFTDAFRAAGYGLGLTFPDFSRLSNRNPMRYLPPLARIDYIFYSSGLQATQAWTSHISGGADHRPVFAELAIIPQGSRD